MTKEREYRQNAADTMELANRATSNSDKSRLLALAERWLDLADRAHRRLRGHPPAFKQQNKDDQPDAE